MFVIADTSPLNYLVLIDAIDILPKLYGRVAVPQPVLHELLHPDTPALVSEWARELPVWAQVVPFDVALIDNKLAELDAGERAAIALAQTFPNALLLMDDAKGRKEAGERHIATVGTLGILRDAASLGWVNLPEAFHLLRQTTFRLPVALIAHLLKEL